MCVYASNLVQLGPHPAEEQRWESPAEKQTLKIWEIYKSAKTQNFLHYESAKKPTT